ncbi:MAG: FAD-linked oxidase C-terminal domain-containing protein [Desulfobulbaceae bacterium]
MDRAILDQIATIVGPGNLAISPEETSCYSYDGTGRMFPPDAVAFPGSTEEVAAILKTANKHGFPVVPRGAGTGMTGGSLPVRGGLVLVTSRMNRIREIDPENMIAVVEPGVITGDLQEALVPYGLMYPPDPASLGFCTIGGNAAECAGGPSAVKYGVTRDYVLGAEIALPDGRIMRTGVRTEKGVVGYDLTRLFVGSEGTLGIFTSLILKLVPLPEAKETFLLTFPAIERATLLVAAILAAGITPCTLEYMDETAISVIRDRLARPLPPDTSALLLLEVDGTAEEVRHQVARLETYLSEQAVNFRRAIDEKHRSALWEARRAISPASFALKPHKISEDIVVPRSRIPDLVSFTGELSRSLGLVILTFGHAGDGNIHVNIMVDRDDEGEYQNGLIAREKLFTRTLELGGTISGEHGVGITKAPFLSGELDSTAVSVMRSIKKMLDPNNILNPGKIFSDDDTPLPGKSD